MSLSYEFLVQWVPSTGNWKLYQYLDSDGGGTLTLVKKGQWSSIRTGHELIPIGNYVIDRTLKTNDYTLWNVDIAQADFLPTSASSGNLGSALPFTDTKIIPLGNYLLLYSPSTGKWECRRFDPTSPTLMQAAASPQNIRGQWRTWANMDLIPVAGYVVCRNPADGAVSGWMFDGGNATEILPGVQIPGMNWAIGQHHRLCTLGDRVVAWRHDSTHITLWPVDPAQTQPSLPSKSIPAWEETLLDETVLFGLTPLVPLTLPNGVQGGDAGQATIPWMRKNIKKVVYLMLENRSLDHLFGDLYANEKIPNLIGPGSATFDGADSKRSNSYGGTTYYQTKRAGAHFPQGDPYHGFLPVARQLFSDGHYRSNRVPDMTGFAYEYAGGAGGPQDVMSYYASSAVEPMTSLAKEFAVSDAWFSSAPGPTDPNRAFGMTGSSYGTMDNFDDGAIYVQWPNHPRRPGIWDALWSHGLKDWKLYHQADWQNFNYTYQLFLKGHIQSVDKAPASFISDMSELYSSAKSGTLPAFSHIEPAWLGNSSGVPANSCHPPTDVEAGLELIANIYNALKAGPDFKHTLLVVTFDEHGGIYDHVPPPFAKNPYRADADSRNQGFAFDLHGVRVPTVLICPWIEKGTVFRSIQAGRNYDATSFIATLLAWQGIPPSNWWLGDRIRATATFESVFTRSASRSDAPSSMQSQAVPAAQLDMPMHDLHQVTARRIVHSLCEGVMSREDAESEARAICASGSLRQALDALQALQARVRKLRATASA